MTDHNLGFWSYARTSDPEDLDVLHELLEKEIRNSIEGPFKLWKDKYDLQLGNDFPENIQDALEQATVFLPVVTPAWWASEWCQREYRFYLECMKSPRPRRLLLPIYWREIDALSEITKVGEDGAINVLRRANFSCWHNSLENDKFCLRELFQVQRANAVETRREINRIAERVSSFIRGEQSYPANQNRASFQAAPLSHGTTRKPSYPPSSRLEAPASVEVSTGGNYECSAEAFELGVVAAFESSLVETRSYRFVLAAIAARIQVDAQGASVDPQSCRIDFVSEIVDIRYKQRREWEIRSKNANPLKGEYFKDFALCKILCHDSVVVARASIVARNHDILVVPGTVETNGKFTFRHINQRKLIELWLKEKLALHCNSALGDIILHESEVRTSLEQ